MPRQRNIIPSTRINLALPEDVRARLDTHLFSEVEGRIPQGAYQAFLSARIREYLDGQTLLDIGPLSGIAPANKYTVQGTAESISFLKAILEP